MKIIRLAAALLLASSASILLAQTPAPAKDEPPPGPVEPFIVDAHPAPYRSTIYYHTNVGNQRFDMRDATLLDIISVAYNHRDETILGGPTWIDFDRFDVVAKISSLKLPTPAAAPANSQDPQNSQNLQNLPNPYDQIRPVLKRVLTERFHLTYHMEDRPLPGYVMTLAKEGAKLTEAKDPTAASNCKAVQDKATPGQAVLNCTSETMEQFLASFGGLFPHPVIDRTGLKKSYDFSLKLVFANLQSRDDYIRVYTDAFRQQLGLVVAPGDVPQPAFVVDKVDRTPTPNAPDIAKLIPDLPDLEFEVASIKPAADTEPQGQMRPLGSQITFSSFSIQQLLVQAWQLRTGAQLGNAPAWIDHVRYTILVKLPPDIDARSVYQDQDQISKMLQKLLIDRFQIKYHWGEQTQDGYVLLAGTPKMKKADPNSRTFCDYGPPTGEKDVSNGPDAPYDHEFHCQNVTMAQFADLVQPMAGSEVKNRVPDKTGLAGAYDFTLFYTSGHKLRVDAAAAAAKQAEDAAASEPILGLTVEDAFRKQLGLRLERQPGTFPALVLDQLEQTPTDN
jgi:uncharacterized protein (TIGR03435 family)